MNRRNSEGYSDPTAYAAMTNLDREEARVRKLQNVIAQLCDVAGFQIQGKIFLVNKESGWTWK